METITLKKYRGRGKNYLILDPNKNEVFLQDRINDRPSHRACRKVREESPGTAVRRTCLLYTSPSPRDCS